MPEWRATKSCHVLGVPSLELRRVILRKDAAPVIAAIIATRYFTKASLLAIRRALIKFLPPGEK